MGKLAIEQAQRTGRYSELKHADFIISLQTFLPDSMDLVISCESAQYLGALDDLMSSVANVVRPGGVFMFSIDSLADEEAVSSNSYELKLTGRWAHRQSHVEAAFSKNGFILVQTTKLSGSSRFTATGELNDSEERHG